jgi:hypothetical protein
VLLMDTAAELQLARLSDALRRLQNETGRSRLSVDLGATLGEWYPELALAIADLYTVLGNTDPDQE